MGIGKPRHRVDVSHGYLRLAQEDEQAALLQQAGQHRNAIYFFLQAMEKQVRGKAFSIVNADSAPIRNLNRNHSIEDALDFLMTVVDLDDCVKQQIAQQLNTYFVGDLRYHQLHNDLRYPFHSEKYSNYSVLEVTKNDCELIATRLCYLKNILRDLDRYR